MGFFPILTHQSSKPTAYKTFSCLELLEFSNLKPTFYLQWSMKRMEERLRWWLWSVSLDEWLLNIRKWTACDGWTSLHYPRHSGSGLSFSLLRESVMFAKPSGCNWQKQSRPLYCFRKALAFSSVVVRGGVNDSSSQEQNKCIFVEVFLKREVQSWM